MIVNQDKIKNAADIKDVLEALGFQLNGKNAMPCPVHGGKNNNFTVKNGIATCWSGCGGQHWNSVDFLMEYKGMTYPEALQFIANIYKIPVEYQQGENAKRTIAKEKAAYEAREAMYIINKTVTNAYFDEHFKTITHKNWNITGYKDNYSIIWGVGRTFSLDTIAEFKLSLAPESWQFLTDFAEKNHLDKNKMLEMGLLRKSEKGRIYDFFRNRIIIPIYNERGKIAGFTARILPCEKHDKQNPKYKNSPESLIYQKKNILFGLWHTKKHIRKAKEALLVEGNMDVISLYDNGIRNVAATGGTALTFAQAKLLKKYTDNVTIVMDGDAAGINAMRRAIPICVAAGLNVKIAILPEGEDPDSFVRNQKKKGFDFLLQEESQIGIEWIARQEAGEANDPFAIDAALKAVTDVISRIQAKSLREEFCKRCAKILKKPVGTVKEEVQKIIARRLAKASDENFQRYTEDQKRSIRMYGFYEENNATYKMNFGDDEGKEISNFVVKPLFLVKSKENQRLFEITNKRGITELIVERTKVFVSLDNFKAAVEDVGDFIFEGDKHDFLRVKRKVYSEMPPAIQLNVLGHHPAGFWAWANGLYIYKTNEFIPCDEYGIVEFEQKTYYLPALSVVNEKHDESEEDEYEDEKAFCYKPSQYTFEDWSSQFITVHKDNGKIGMMFFFAMLFRDFIYAKFKQYPHINPVGPTGSGKSFLMWSIVQMFGRKMNPFMLKSGTDVAFFNRWTRFRNAFAWHDEYFNDITPERIQFLKYAADGVGRERGQKTSNRSLRSHVLPALGISGQDFPSADSALFNRVINLVYSKSDFTNEERMEAEKLVKMQDTNSLSGLTSIIVAKRVIIEQKFNLAFDAIYSKLKKETQDNKDLVDRLLRSNVIILTIFKILEQEFQMPFDFKEAYRVVKKNMLRHATMLGESSETNEFFEIFQHLIRTGYITENKDYKIWSTQKITLIHDTKKKTTQAKEFDEMKELIALNLNKVHPFYLQESKKQGRKKTQSKPTLQHYLRSLPSYVGESRNVKGVGYSFVFELDLLNMHLKDDDQDTTEDTTENTTTEDPDAPIPF